MLCDFQSSSLKKLTLYRGYLIDITIIEFPRYFYYKKIFVVYYRSEKYINSSKHGIINCKPYA